jgi:hypothetical protein
VSLLSPAPFPVQECVSDLTLSTCGLVPDPYIIMRFEIYC